MITTFPDAATPDDAPVDADLSLITAYLARELTLVELTAVEQRLTNDAAFRVKVQPLLDLWELPLATAEIRLVPAQRPWRRRLLRIAAVLALTLGGLTLLSRSAVALFGLEGPPGESTTDRIRGLFERTAVKAAIAPRKVEFPNGSSVLLSAESDLSYRPQGSEGGKATNGMVMALTGEAVIDVSEVTHAIYLGTPVARLRLSPGRYFVRSVHRDSTMSVRVERGYMIVLPRGATPGTQYYTGESGEVLRGGKSPPRSAIKP